jgi:ribA/ribD-fused uncharacterized protein
LSAIARLDGGHAFLSNFYPVALRIGGVCYPTLEHAFQAMKTFVPGERRRIAEASSPGKAKRLGGPKARGGIATLRPDWEEVKGKVMLALLRRKFADSALAFQLCATAPDALVEGNHHGDREWGAVCESGEWVGRNRLGRGLEMVRSEALSGASRTLAELDAALERLSQPGGTS